jgi:acyl-CoA synthetase (AMP-forming)/AMP-acid ligase II
MPGEPMDSVGRVSSKKIVILDANDQPCPPGIVDDNDRLVNYEEAVGEIAREIGEDNIFFDGYFKNNQATNKKYRNGYYCSGDLGHIRVIDGKRFLFFNGRTDDWIRKDGENFSAENVTKYAESMPGVELAVAYGAPCSVSDEKAMAAIKLYSNMSFDPQAAFDWFMDQERHGGMDPKWMPDYIRIVDNFPVTRTHKLLIRPLKRDHFNIEKCPEMKIYYRQRGDTTYHLFTRETYLDTRQNFEKNGRLQLLD